MIRSGYVPVIGLLALAAAFTLRAAEDTPLFRSDVALVRVDAQVLDRSNRAITGLSANDFVLYEEGKQQEIRNFATEDLPVDVLLLLDVSGSMRPHVERIASASHQALGVLGPSDRVAIMVFDRETRVRLPFRDSREAVERELDRLLQQETFDGGTDITRALLDAASYVGREGRREARKAVVILTDDETERNRDEARVSSAFVRVDAVLMALLAPDAMRSHGGMGSGWPGSGGGGYPGAGGGGYPRRGGYPGGGLGGPLGGINLGRRGPLGGGGGPVIGRAHTQSAGTAEIARQSGGDSMRVDDASALRDTLERIRQRYALHFHLPPGATPGQERSIEVQLSADARRRYPDAEVRFRQKYLAPEGGSGPVQVSEASSVPAPAPASGQGNDEPALRHRRPAVDEPAATKGPLPNTSSGGWPVASPSSPSVSSPALTPAPAPAETDAKPKKGGWRQLKPGEQP
jgi:Mg-chelatase subunit ChlD